jgi:hypothetical protein
VTGRRRGQCPDCRYRWPLRADGTLGAHHLYSGSEPQPECAGTGRLPAPGRRDPGRIVVAGDWHGFRETLNCGHHQLRDSERRIGQVTACELCPLTVHNPGSPGVPCAAVRVIVGISPVQAPQGPDHWGPEHWHGT